MSSSETMEETEGKSSAMNAFSVLLQAAKERSHVPTKYTIKQPNAKLTLKNDVIEWLAQNQLGWEKAFAESVGRTFVNTLADVLWYIDGNFATLHDRGCGVTACFESFQGYNKPEERKKRKRDETNLKASELTAFSNSLFTLASSSYLKADRWKSVYEGIQ